MPGFDAQINEAPPKPGESAWVSFLRAADGGAFKNAPEAPKVDNETSNREMAQAGFPRGQVEPDNSLVFSASSMAKADEAIAA